MKAIFEELSREAWLVLISLECEEVVAFSEGMLHVRITHQETGYPLVVKQKIQDETLDQLEKYNLIEHVPGEHLDTIKLTDAGRYRPILAEAKRESRNK